MVERIWVEAPRPLPDGVARAWMAVDGGVAVAGVFELFGGMFHLAYHRLGDAFPTILRFNTFEQAQSEANARLSNVKVIPRAMPMMLRQAGHA